MLESDKYKKEVCETDQTQKACYSIYSEVVQKETGADLDLQQEKRCSSYTTKTHERLSSAEEISFLSKPDQDGFIALFID